MVAVFLHLARGSESGLREIDDDKFDRIFDIEWLWEWGNVTGMWQRDLGRKVWMINSRCKEWMKNIFWDWKDQEDKRVVLCRWQGKGTSLLVLPAMAIFRQAWWSSAMNDLVRNSVCIGLRYEYDIRRHIVGTNENLDNLSTLRWKEKMCPLTV